MLVLVLAFLAMFTRVGADCYWLVALGDHIRATGAIPDGIPFAAAPTADWPNVVVLAALALSGLHSISDNALPVAQLVVDAITLALVAVGARRAGASDRATAGVIFAVAAGSLASLAIVRLQIFSFIPFVLLLLLLRSQARLPTWQIWLVPPLVALWSNLHGAVLLGVCVAGAYLLFSRMRVRPLETVGVGVATLAALLVTPAGIRTIDYYVGVLRNEAAQRGEGLWARPDLGHPFDVLMLLAAGVLVLAACRRRLPVWEYVVLAGLAVATVLAARNGTWLLMAAAPPAAVGLTRRSGEPRPAGQGPGLLAPLVTTALASILAVAIVVPRDDVLAADPELVSEVAELAGDRVVMAPEPLSESLAVAGVTLWAVNPIDAFAPADQEAFLDFLEGDPGMRRAVEGSDVVVVERDSDAAAAMVDHPDFTRRDLGDGWVAHVREP